MANQFACHIIFNFLSNLQVFSKFSVTGGGKTKKIKRQTLATLLVKPH